MMAGTATATNPLMEDKPAQPSEGATEQNQGMKSADAVCVERGTTTSTDTEGTNMKSFTTANNVPRTEGNGSGINVAAEGIIAKEEASKLKEDMTPPECPTSEPTTADPLQAPIEKPESAAVREVKASSETASVPMLQLTEEDLSPIPVSNRPTVFMASVAPVVPAPSVSSSPMQWAPASGSIQTVQVSMGTSPEEAIPAYTPSDPCITSGSTDTTGGSTHTPGLGSATGSSGSLPTSRVVSENTIAASSSEASLQQMKPPSPSTIPGFAGDPSAVNFSASGFGNVAMTSSQTTPVSIPGQYPSQSVPTMSSTNPRGQPFQGPMPMDTQSITPVNSSSNLIASYSFSPGSPGFEPGSPEGRRGSMDSLGGGLNQNRQKRLQRNRESARLSRRRRKHYLEVLEERVANLSEAMDAGRRDHVFRALTTVKEQRAERLQIAERDLFSLTASGGAVGGPGAAEVFPRLEDHLRVLNSTVSRTSDELRVAVEFQKEQIKSLLLPAHVRYILWMTVQNEPFFRGGRANSERLSAARIGEKMLANGNDRVPPCNGMWPLFCHDVGLSYEQEEKIRAFQRNLLIDKESWLHRHTTRATGAAIQSSFRCVNGVSEMVRRRENSVLSVLTPEQKIRFLSWARRRATSVRRVMERTTIPASCEARTFKLDSALQPSPERHTAANLYILDRNLQAVQRALPTVPSLVGRDRIKKFSRRPAFESLGSHLSSIKENTGPVGAGAKRRALSADDNCPPSPMTPGSQCGLRLSDAQGQGGQITPEAAQIAAAPVVSEALGAIGIALRGPSHARPQPHHLRQVLAPATLALPVQSAPPPGRSFTSYSNSPLSHPGQTAFVPVAHCMAPSFSTSPVASAPVASAPVALAGGVAVGHRRLASGHRRELSLLNSPLPSTQEDVYMNVVPEHGDSTTDEFLMELANEDWAIGGFEMKT